jgi:exodeoxyribonuclease VII small subunit
MLQETEVPFETAVSQLELIIETLERGEPDLAGALARYEAGVRLLNQCYGLLERAERAVALLTGVDADGKAITIPFDATATDQAERTVSKAGRANRPRRAVADSEPEPASGPDRNDPPF